MQTNQIAAITGATGLVGAHLGYRIAGEYHKVIGIYHTRQGLESARSIFHLYPDGQTRFESIEWREADINDVTEIYAVLQGVQTVFHCAALVSFDPADAERLLLVNHLGTANVVNACLAHKVSRFCHVSSTAALGAEDADGYVRESSKWNEENQSVYGLSKHLAEREVWRGAEEGLNMVIVNPSIIIGPGNWESGSPALLRRVSEGLSFYSSGANGFVGVWDVVESMMYLSRSEIRSQRHTISSQNLSFREILNMVAEAFNMKSPRYHVPDFLTDIVWRIERVRSGISGDKPLITKESAKSASRTTRYSVEKANRAGLSFTPVAEVIKKAVALQGEYNRANGSKKGKN